MHERYDEVLTPDALALLGVLHREFDDRRRGLLALRFDRAAKRATGAVFEFLTETRAICGETTWRVAPPAPGLMDRRVEITGPTDAKVTINALNSGAKVWLADYAVRIATWEKWNSVSLEVQA